MDEDYAGEYGDFYDPLRTLGIRPTQVYPSSPPIPQELPSSVLHEKKGSNPDATPSRPAQVYASSPPIPQELLSSFSEEKESSSAGTTPSPPPKRRRFSASHEIFPPTKSVLDAPAQPSSPPHSCEGVCCNHSAMMPSRVPCSNRTVTKAIPSLDQHTTVHSLSPTLPQPSKCTENWEEVPEESGLPASTSDLTYRPSSTAVSPSTQSCSISYDKPEIDVLVTARGFLQLLRNTLYEILPETEALSIDIRYAQCINPPPSCRVYLIYRSVLPSS